MVEMRKVVFLVAVMSTWVTLILAADELTWNINKANVQNYNTLIQNVRGQVQGTTCFRIPMIRAPLATPQYFIVRIESRDGKVIRLALAKLDLYVVGYSDTANGIVRAFYFSDAPKNVFTDVKVKDVHNLGYTGSYQNLESRAGKTRPKINLSKNQLIRLINNIHGVDINSDTLRREQAEFLLVSVVMIPEAARFQYIALQVRGNYNKDLAPNQKVVTIVNEWGAISTRIATANRDGKFRNSLKLTDPRGRSYTVSTVDQVRMDMGLPKYVAGQCARTLTDLPEVPQA